MKRALILIFALVACLVASPAIAGVFDAPGVPWGKSTVAGNEVTVLKAGSECQVEALKQLAWTRQTAVNSFTVCVPPGYDQARLWGHERQVHVVWRATHAEASVELHGGVWLVIPAQATADGCLLLVDPGSSGGRPGDGVCTTSTGLVYLVRGRQ